MDIVEGVKSMNDNYLLGRILVIPAILVAFTNVFAAIATYLIL